MTILTAIFLSHLLWDDDQANLQQRLEHRVSLDQMDQTCLDKDDESFMPRYDLAAVHAIQGNKAEANRRLPRLVDVG
jgi:hypothetical protein